jgi:hypothetical protein
MDASSSYVDEWEWVRVVYEIWFNDLSVARLARQTAIIYQIVVKRDHESAFNGDCFSWG